MESFKQAQKRWWYRLIKVCYVLFFAFSIVFLTIVSLVEFSPRDILDTQTSTFRCLVGNQKTYFFDEAGFSDVPTGNYGRFIIEKKSEELCGVFFTQTTLGNLQQDDRSYEIETSYIQGSWGPAISFSVVVILVTTIILELLRRVFYYVVFGTFWVRKLKNSDQKGGLGSGTF